jgi:NTE family protein
LQGGGAHGAFTWGVLDRLLEDDRLWVTGISGTSAGAMNAVVLAQGLADGGAESGRAALERFWSAISEAGQRSPLQRNPINMLFGSWTLDNSPAYIMFDLMSRLASPYDLNPLNINPLRDLLGAMIDFEKVRACKDAELFISATNVETGRVRVFRRHETTIDVVMASACLPQIFQAVEIDGQTFWDGGYMGNPVLFPFFEQRGPRDTVIVQINPVFRPGVPKTAREIDNRINEITFNSSLLKELRTIEFVTRMIEEGKLDASHAKPMRIHMIDARKKMRPLGSSSKLNTEWWFLTYLRDVGREAAGRWLETNYDGIGKHSTLDIPGLFGKLSQEDKDWDDGAETDLGSEPQSEKRSG